jgi:hypothetical protein
MKALGELSIEELRKRLGDLEYALGGLSAMGAARSPKRTSASSSSYGSS